MNVIHQLFMRPQETYERLSLSIDSFFRARQLHRTVAFNGAMNIPILESPNFRILQDPDGRPRSNYS
jgi:hypothetical protein